MQRFRSVTISRRYADRGIGEALLAVRTNWTGRSVEFLETFRALSTSRYRIQLKSRYRPTTAITLIRCMLLPTCSRLLSFFFFFVSSFLRDVHIAARRGAISASLYRDYPLGVKICITEHYAIRPQLFTAMRFAGFILRPLCALARCSSGEFFDNFREIFAQGLIAFEKIFFFFPFSGYA